LGMGWSFHVVLAAPGCESAWNKDPVFGVIGGAALQTVLNGACRLAPCDYAIDRALPLAEIFTAPLAAVLVKT